MPRGFDSGALLDVVSNDQISSCLLLLFSMDINTTHPTALATLAIATGIVYLVVREVFASRNSCPAISDSLAR
jgi:hypothetical protein